MPVFGTGFRKSNRGRRLALLPALLLAWLAAAVLAGCGGGSGRAESGNKVIATSFYPVYIMTKNIAWGIPGVEVVNITRPTTGCLHDYQFTTGDLRNLDQADCFVINGAGMESFLDKVTSQRPDLKIIDSSKGIELIRDNRGVPNPHLWVSVSLAMRQVQNIAGQLAAADPDHASAYRKNAAAYLQQLEQLREKMRQALAPYRGSRIITFHEAFPYFAREFGLEVAAVVEREPGSEPSAGELAQTVALVKRSWVRVIFAEPQYSSKAAQVIAEETGARVFTLDPAVTGPDGRDAYIKIMEKNLAVLQQALGGKS